jgi:hypothetical protein
MKTCAEPQNKVTKIHVVAVWHTIEASMTCVNFARPASIENSENSTYLAAQHLELG